jgi:hypothetical protein
LKTNLYILILLFVLLISPASIRPLNAFSDEVKSEEILNRKKWKELSKDTDYTETFKEFDKKDKPKKEEKRKERNPIQLPSLKPVLMVLVIGLLSFLIFLVLNKFFKFFDERVTNDELKVTVENLEDNIHKADFEHLLNQALSKNEFKLAIRILYLKIIKLLSDNQHIIWKREKTNGHYVRELSSGKLGKTFAFLTLAYEEAWFSNHSVDKNKYELISKHFLTFINQLI